MRSAGEVEKESESRRGGTRILSSRPGNLFRVSNSETALSHGVDVLRLDLVEHTFFAGLRVRIFVLPQILLRHLVDVLGGALLGNLVYATRWRSEEHTSELQS